MYTFIKRTLKIFFRICVEEALIHLCLKMVFQNQTKKEGEICKVAVAAAHTHTHNVIVITIKVQRGLKIYLYYSHEVRTNWQRQGAINFKQSILLLDEVIIYG